MNSRTPAWDELVRSEAGREGTKKKGNVCADMHVCARAGRGGGEGGGGACNLKLLPIAAQMSSDK